MTEQLTLSLFIIVYTVNQKFKEMQIYAPQALVFHLTGVPAWSWEPIIVEVQATC